eukprot:TRINITY_DN6418_c0_g1_i2.p2 TRINITY_DN6418_c0_g1~~TRINITY_DN6418_c0_g1_i2.p2  ORF type:complete len:192 (-),score=28.91 TRINITY_DN6418_c0_g1_i2:285-860(-)
MVVWDGQGASEPWQRAESQWPELLSSGIERCCTKIELDKLLQISHQLPAHSAPTSAMPEPAQSVQHNPRHSPLRAISLENSVPSLSQESSAYSKPAPGLSVLTAPPGLSVLTAPPGLEVMGTPSCQSRMAWTQTWSLEGDTETPSSASESTHGACSRSQSPSSSVDTQDTKQLESSSLRLGSSKPSFQDNV